MSPETTKVIGDRAERKAKDFLIAQGLRFITQNYRCKMGEIDLVLRDGDTWVFVEVKYRSDTAHGEPVEFFTAVKQRRVLNAVKLFLLDNQLNEFHTSIRIDVIAIHGDALQWFKNVTG